MEGERQRRVLVIDDDASVREVVCLLLTSFGYDSQSASDGASGLARFDEGGWDMVLTELSMPGMSGWAVAEVIRRQSPTLPIVLITGRIDAEVQRRAEEWGLPVVPKPFRVEMLRTIVTNRLQASPSFEPSSS
jgi:CheY-like chemotaxis protein